MLVLYGATLIIELILYIKPLWAYHKYFYAALLLAVSALAIIIAVSYWSAAALGLLIVAGFRVINYLRITVGRINEKQLYNRTFQTSVALTAASAVLIALIITQMLGDFSLALLQSLMFVQFGVAVLIFLVTMRNIIKTSYTIPSDYYSDKELPSITVAIPARNETNDLEDCLRSILASDYPKLEVIVLDDCSQDKTADVIKKFANAGVRFVQGGPPKDGWLAKNQAYSKLYDEASGQHILFCGVDVRVGARAVRQLMTSLLNKNKLMVSVLPRRLTGTPSAAFIQPMRYWWELALPRRLLNKPPVLSTCWLINKAFLKSKGGFSAVSNNILPERYFAREAIKQDGYSFMRAHNELDVQTFKGLDEQKQTAVRMRYPQVRRRPEMVLLISAAQFVFLFLPFVFIFIDVFVPLFGYFYLSYAACAFIIASHLAIIWVTNPVNLPIAVVNFPVIVLTEIVLIYESMLKYEFSKVEWRGRNICVPVMQTIPKLPKA